MNKDFVSVHQTKFRERGQHSTTEKKMVSYFSWGCFFFSWENSCLKLYAEKIFNNIHLSLVHLIKCLYLTIFNKPGEDKFYISQSSVLSYRTASSFKTACAALILYFLRSRTKTVPSEADAPTLSPREFQQT